MNISSQRKFPCSSRGLQFSTRGTGGRPISRDKFYNMKIVLVVLGCTLCLFAPLQAQPSSPSANPQLPPLPPGPWLKPAPVPSQWVVTFSKAPSKGGKTPSSVQKREPPSSNNASSVGGAAQVIKQIVVYKSANLLLEQTLDHNGTTIVMWRVKGLFLTKMPSYDKWIVSAKGPANSFSSTDYSHGDFAGFGWISAKNYIGAALVANRECLIFRDKTITLEPPDIHVMNIAAQDAYTAYESRKRARKEGLPVDDDNSNETTPPPFNLDEHKMEATAVIDAETGLPVQLVYATLGGIVIRNFQFQPTPTALLALSPDAQAALDAHYERVKRMSRPSGTP